MTVVTAKDTRVGSSLVPDTGSPSTLQTQNLTRYQKLVGKRGEDSLDTVQVCGKWIPLFCKLYYTESASRQKQRISSSAQLDASDDGYVSTIIYSLNLFFHVIYSPSHSNVSISSSGINDEKAQKSLVEESEPLSRRTRSRYKRPQDPISKGPIKRIRTSPGGSTLSGKVSAKRNTSVGMWQKFSFDLRLIAFTRL